MTATITGELLIGQDEPKRRPQTVDAINPSTGEKLDPPFSVASVEDVDRACKLAAEAFDQYRAFPLERRAAFLETIADRVASLGEALLDRAMAETGLPFDRLQPEFNRTVNQLRLFARVVRDGEWLDLRVNPTMPDRTPFPRPDIRLRQIGIGPVAVFGSSNFPLAFSVAGGDMASALAAGCPVVIKGHLAHPGTGELVARAVKAAVREAGMPEGVFSLLPGANETGAALVRHPAIKAVGFTGSRMGGLALGAIAAARPEPIPVYAEMSSVNPVFLFPAALEHRAEALAAEFVASLTVGWGQLCTNPGLLFAVAGPSLDRFVNAAGMLVAGNSAGPMLTSAIHAAFDRGVARLAGSEGVSEVARGQAPSGPNRSPAVFFDTDADTFKANPALAEEVFGASGLLVTCRDIEEMHTVVEGLEGQLTATVHVDQEDYPAARSLLPRLERKVGRILANGWPTGVEVCDAMVHGGPYPATSDSHVTSVGTMAIRRFLRPISYQNLPADLLPADLTESALAGLPHTVNGIRA